MTFRLAGYRATVVGLSAFVLLALPGCKRDHEHVPSAARSAPVESPIVTLQSGATTARVDVRSLPTETVKGRPAVKLRRLWEAAALPAPARLDLVGDDGFRPGSKPKCPERLAGNLLDRGWIDPVTRNVLWDDALGLPGCYRVYNVARIEGGE